VITTDLDFHAYLSEVVSTAGWSIRAAATVEEAIPETRDRSCSLVIYDCNETDDWRGAFDRLRSVNSTTCLLLASRVTDPYLWQEVIDAGGFDVLPRSAPQDELIRKLRFAWFWNERWQPTSNRRIGRGSEKPRNQNDASQ